MRAVAAPYGRAWADAARLREAPASPTNLVATALFHKCSGQLMPRDVVGGTKRDLLPVDYTTWF